MSDTRTAPAAPSPGEQQPPEQRPSRGGALAYAIAHQNAIVILVALVIALLIGAALIRAQGVNPWYAYETLVREALVYPGAFTRTLQKTTPLVLTGLAVVIPLRLGLFNIGGQGQFAMGAIAGAWVAYLAGGAGFLGAVLGMLAGIALGGLVGLLVGVLKAYRGVHEVISTIMLNYIVSGVTFWLVVGPLQAERSKTSGIPQTESIPAASRVGALSGVPIGFVIAAVLAALCWWMLSRTTLGFRFNTVGANKSAAGYAGIRINTMVVLSVVIGAGLAGLGGALEAEGTLHRFEPAIVGSLGFDGITIALLARANPLATIPAAFLVGVLRTGAAGLQFSTGIAPEIVDLLLALILLMVSIPVLGTWLFRSRADKVSVASTSWGS
ncbi:ABC transporter permease [Phycicoccus endophyticus]|uniref:ABC transporter permease n=1 Tax=Phycicoccus endophyticus TaxID=1690220 RepID=A0A7G9R0Q0_9MICO|nr:ABC transporter permease [Phycicoccus endophyticus]NHI19459.1 ABC transporter permease [Phycicoccus endophyticus]QNN49175.1 ABC transporter permease [Phycicoccus endophyticus]GGL39350.1 ABC transporter permease [Phycicoccus endophyticus]